MTGIAVEPESEQFRGATGLGKDLVHRLGDVVDRERVKGHSEDSIKVVQEETGLREGSSKALVLVSTEVGSAATSELKISISTTI